MAKKFKFRVEAVLRMRQQTEQAALRKMADAQRKVADIENGLRDIQYRLNQQDAMVREGVLTGTVDVHYMSLYRRHVMTLHRRMIDLAGELHQATSDLARQRASTLTAIKERKVLSSLKEKLHTRHMTELDREEQRETDDLNVMRAGHRKTLEAGAR